MLLFSFIPLCISEVQCLQMNKARFYHCVLFLWMSIKYRCLFVCLCVCVCVCLLLNFQYNILNSFIASHSSDLRQCYKPCSVLEFSNWEELGRTETVSCIQCCNQQIAYSCVKSFNYSFPQYAFILVY